MLRRQVHGVDNQVGILVEAAAGVTLRAHRSLDRLIHSH